MSKKILQFKKWLKITKKFIKKLLKIGRKKMAKILVTGAAGYIGSHLCLKLLKENFKIIGLDNFSTGFLEPVEILKNKFSNFEFINLDLADEEKLSEIFEKNEIKSVIHLAAKIDVAESVQKPSLYLKENYENSVKLINKAVEFGISKIISSSTAAVYGNPVYTPIDEKHPTNPLSPYGQTKLDFEKYLEKIKNLNYVIFRYFNVGGSDSNGLIGKSHLKSNDLIENIIKTILGQKPEFQIFGSDYQTKDGTSVRDLIHVEDVANAHFLALQEMEKHKLNTVYNLGSESGYTVLEILGQAEKIAGKNIPVKKQPRRDGDIAVSVATSQKAKNELNWEISPKNLEKIITTDLNWRKKHPLGYTK
jgi:UDP-glucose 4-epimerase